MDQNSTHPHELKSPKGTKVDKILQTFYESITTLEAWIRKADTEGFLESSLITEDDKKGYKHLVETTLVAAKADGKRLMTPFSFSQYFHQHELVTRSVARVLKRDGIGNNVLSFGFGPITDNPKASVCNVLDIEYRYPNSSVNRLQYSAWETLLSRDEFERPAGLVRPSSIVPQPLETDTTEVLVNKDDFLTCGLLPALLLLIAGFFFSIFLLDITDFLVFILIGDTLMSHLLENTSVFILLIKPAVYLQITGEPVYQLWPYSAGLHWNVKEHLHHCGKSASVRTQSKPNKVTRLQGKPAQVTGETSDSSHPFVPSGWMEKSVKTSSSSKPLHSGLKRKRRDEADEECPKRRKLTDHKDHPDDPPRLSVCDFPLSVVPETSGSSSENLTADGVYGRETESVKGHLMSEVPQLTKRQKKRMRLKRKKQKSKPCSPDAKAYQYHLYVPRLSLLYGKYLREKFPANFGPTRLHPSDEGARDLFTDIFVQGSVGGNVTRTDRCQCQETEKLIPENRKGENNLSDVLGVGRSCENTQKDSPHCMLLSQKSLNQCDADFSHSEKYSDSDSRTQIQSMGQGELKMDLQRPSGLQSRTWTVSSFVGSQTNEQRMKACSSDTLSQISEPQTTAGIIKTSDAGLTSSNQLSFCTAVSKCTSSDSCSLPCGQREAEQVPSQLDRVWDEEAKWVAHDISNAQGKHFTPCHPDSASNTAEHGTPMQISVEDMTSQETLECDHSAASSTDMFLAESPSLFQTTSTSSSSSFATSNPSLGTGSWIGSPRVPDGPRFCGDSRSQDRISEQVSMMNPASKDVFSDNTDQDKSKQSASTSGHKEMQIHHKDTLLGSRRTVFEQVPSTLHRECQQGQVSGKEGDPKGSVTAQEEGAEALLETINTPTINTPTLQDTVLPVLQTFLLRHRKCKYWSLLNCHCPSQTDTRKAACCQAPTGTRERRKGRWMRQIGVHQYTATAKLLEDYVSHQKVFAFLRSVVKHTIPVQLVGSLANMAIFLKNVRSLVSSGKFEKMCLGQLMKGMKVKGCEWLNAVSCHMEKQHLMAQLVWWLVNSFILPLIRTFFYVTDTTTYRNRLFYYRKRTWLRLKTRAVQEFRKAASLKAVSKSQVDCWLATGQTLGVSVLRFLPKARSLRPIVNMSRKPKPRTEQKKSVNQQLNRLFQALTSEKASDESTCGCSVFGVEDIYKKLRGFKEERASRHDDRELYFVKSDVSNCFDSIQQDRLFQIVKAILFKDNEQIYMTRKFASVHVNGKRLKRVFHTDTIRLTQYQPDFVCFLRRKYSCGRWNDIIVVDMALFHEEKTESLLQVLSSHLFNNVIKVGGRFYLQTTGISQGSVMSTLLACIYLAHLERTHLSVLEDELLIRRMDDYLFITPDKARAELFVYTMVKGFPDFNCFTNVEKILTNFPVLDPSVGAVRNMEQKGLFPWCGLMIDTCSLDVSVDYSRYSGLSVTDTATFDTCYKAGQTLSSKLLMCLKIKCHAIFFDSQLNSRERILLNVYQALLFVALVFHSFVVKLPAWQRVESNPRFFANIMKTVPRYMQNVVARKLQQAKCAYKFPVRFHVLQWLNADAFLVRLHRYPGYKPLKKLLRARKLSSQRKLDQKDVAVLREIHLAAMRLDSTVVLFRAGK